jgi:hypothetical protein
MAGYSRHCHDPVWLILFQKAKTVNRSHRCSKLRLAFFSLFLAGSLSLSFSKDLKPAVSSDESAPEEVRMLSGVLKDDWDHIRVSFVHRCPCTGGSIRKVMLKRGADGILTLQADVQYRALQQKGDPVVFRESIAILKLDELPGLLRSALEERSESEVISHYAKVRSLSFEDAFIEMCRHKLLRPPYDSEDTLALEVLIHRGDKELFKAASDFARDGKAKEFVEWFQVWAEAAGVSQILSKLEKAR